MPRVYQRRFDYDEATRRYEAGESAAALAAEYGVSTSLVYYAVNPEQRARMLAYVAAYQRGGTCPDCGGPSSRTGAASRRCVSCAAKRAATSVRDDELQCVVCREWKPDDAFPHHHGVKGRVRRARHTLCRACATVERRRYRESRKVPCSHGCGTMVLHENSRYPGKPPECLSCAMRRVHAERRAA